MEKPVIDPSDPRPGAVEEYLRDWHRIGDQPDLGYLSYIAHSAEVMSNFVCDSNAELSQRWARISVQALDYAKHLDPANADRYELSVCRLISWAIQRFGCVVADSVLSLGRVLDLLLPYGAMEPEDISELMVSIKNEDATQEEWMVYIDLVERLDIVRRIQHCLSDQENLAEKFQSLE